MDAYTISALIVGVLVIGLAVIHEALMIQMDRAEAKHREEMVKAREEKAGAK